MANDDDALRRLMGDEEGPSREDKLQRFREICELCARDLAEAAQILLDLNKERLMSFEELESVGEMVIAVRANYRLVRQIITERLHPAWVKFNQQRGQEP